MEALILTLWIVAMPVAIAAALWPSERRARAASRQAEQVGTGTNETWTPSGR